MQRDILCKARITIYISNLKTRSTGTLKLCNMHFLSEVKSNRELNQGLGDISKESRMKCSQFKQKTFKKFYTLSVLQFNKSFEVI